MYMYMIQNMYTIIQRHVEYFTDFMVLRCIIMFKTSVG